MPKDRKFVNPLTQRSEPVSQSSTDTSTLPATQEETYTSTLPATQEETYTPTSTYISSQVQHRNRGTQAFEKTHERITLWVDKSLKQQFERLAREQEVSKTHLLNEAIADLLRKYEG